MKIIAVKPITTYIVETDSKEFNQYVRYGSDCWYITMSESDEPMYDDSKKIERLFQKFIKINNIKG